jgi:peptide/nickel transport system permease protein
MDTPLAELAIDATAPAPAPRAAAWRRLLHNWSVRIGGALLLLLTLVSLLAPWLGTVDPTLIDPVNRDLLPGARAEVVTLTGESFEHRFWMGSDSYGRDIYSRVLYGGGYRWWWASRWHCSACSSGWSSGWPPVSCAGWMRS